LPAEHKVLADYGGTTLDAFAEAAGQRDIVAIVIEFGTKGRVAMRRALLVDRWLNLNGGLNGGRATPAAQALLHTTVAASAPADAAWWEQIVPSGVAVLDQAVAGLAQG
jgi:hypothetical protein